MSGDGLECWRKLESKVIKTARHFARENSYFSGVLALSDVAWTTLKNKQINKSVLWGVCMAVTVDGTKIKLVNIRECINEFTHSVGRSISRFL